MKGMTRMLIWGAVILAAMVLAAPAWAWQVNVGVRQPGPRRGVHHGPRPMFHPLPALPAGVIVGPVLASPPVAAVQVVLPGEQQEKLAAAELERRQEEAYQAARQAKFKKLEARTGRPVRSWQVLNR